MGNGGWGWVCSGGWGGCVVGVGDSSPRIKIIIDS